MNAIQLLTTRSSQPRLTEPAPSGEALEVIKRAAVRVPDHACLRPWRFIICEGAGRKKLGDMMEQAAIASGLSDRDVDRAPELPMRAPLVIVAIAKYKEHAKVPKIEQVASTACAVHSMQMAAFAQGFQGIWRTGIYAQDENMREALYLEDEDEIVGFLYLGTPVYSAPDREGPNPDDYFEDWC